METTVAEKLIQLGGIWIFTATTEVKRDRVRRRHPSYGRPEPLAEPGPAAVIPIRPIRKMPFDYERARAAAAAAI